MVRRNREGGFATIIFAGRETEIMFCLMDSRLHEDKKAFGNDWERLLRTIITEKEAEAICGMTKAFVAHEKDHGTQIDFVHFYSFHVDKNMCKDWFLTYMKKRYPNYLLNIGKDSISFII